MLGTRPRPLRNPLEPVSTAVDVITGLAVLLLILGGLTEPQPALGEGPVCTKLPILYGPSASAAATAKLVGVAPGSHAVSNAAFAVCTDHPDALLRLAGILMALPPLVLFLGALWLLRRLLRSAGRPGKLYSLDTARRLRFLGWYLTGGAIAAAVIESAASGVAMAQQTAYISWAPSNVSLTGLLFLLAAGLAVLTLGRVMRIGVGMRDDLDGTI